MEKKNGVGEILGKSGDVKIVLNFKNTLKNTIKVNGKNEILYTPFVMTVGTILSSNENTNVSITNGEAVNTGTRDILVGIVAPGLYDSLNLEELKNMDKIEISYTTSSFKLNSIYIVATPKLLAKTDLDVFDKMDEIYSKVQTLQDNMNIIEAGAKEVQTGINKISNGEAEISNNLAIAINGIKELKAGSVELDTGLNKVIEALNAAQEELTNSDNESSISQLKYLKSQNANTINTLIAKSGTTFENLSTMYAQYNLKTYAGTDATLTSIKSTYELITLLSANNTAIDKTITSLTGISTQITTLLTELNKNLVNIENGASKISAKLDELRLGVNKIYNGSTELATGANKAYIGTETLANGIATFNKEGINTLSSYANKLKTYSDKVEALTNLSKDYKGFACNNSESTIFVYTIK